MGEEGEVTGIEGTQRGAKVNRERFRLGWKRSFHYTVAPEPGVRELKLRNIA